MIAFLWWWRWRNHRRNDLRLLGCRLWFFCVHSTSLVLCNLYKYEFVVLNIHTALVPAVIAAIAIFWIMVVVDLRRIRARMQSRTWISASAAIPNLVRHTSRRTMRCNGAGNAWLFYVFTHWFSFYLLRFRKNS